MATLSPSSWPYQRRRNHPTREASNSSVEDEKVGGRPIPTTTITDVSAASSSSFSTNSSPIEYPSFKDKKSQQAASQSIGSVSSRDRRSGPNLATASAQVEQDDDHHDTSDIGIKGDQLYDQYLPRPVAWIRRLLVKSLRFESPLLAKHQTLVRRPWMDRYFVYTSLLGTHSFFLIFLPMVFWMGNARFGRGLINVLAFGVYLSSAIKDLLCVPRPYAPPVTRLTIGTHHLEYGFPSTHSTNAVSIAFYLYLWVLGFREHALIVGDSPYASIFETRLWELALLLYSLSIVYGRVYAGMHSLVDCLAGSALGALISWVQWQCFDQIEDFMLKGWKVPLVVIPVGLLMVSVHPQPLDDCPCFEDAIAFIAVAMGVCLGRWLGVRRSMVVKEDNPFTSASNTERIILSAERLLPKGSTAADLIEPLLDALKAPLKSLTGEDQAEVERNTLVYLIRAGTLVVIGVSLILAVRVVAKTLCKILLPPILRFFSKSVGFALPRRHYRPATDYETIPLDDLRTVPSVLDLPSTVVVPEPTSSHSGRDAGALPTTPSEQLLGVPASKARGGNKFFLHSEPPSRTSSPDPFSATLGRKEANFKEGMGEAKSNGKSGSNPKGPRGEMGEDQSSALPAPSIKLELQGSEEEGKTTELTCTNEDDATRSEQSTRTMLKKDSGDDVKRYDADVLTKVIVYSNIGFWATCLIPAILERIGLSPL
ncbi:acid phosphatase/Vanadium-dependent haloperoxidase [Violaceomyces palustris]|uniref:Acid phosphatase/Vanadium-dependent haloperoxidase n=1 Tax=Violaceomyces palustris TaxID=1673888 RepID=A0ACD0P321_9BASI|nr:acid phosphatase/Vanadium-dependent haloperoxidase [Violaceomyces palustris]